MGSFLRESQGIKRQWNVHCIRSRRRPGPRSVMHDGRTQVREQCWTVTVTQHVGRADAIDAYQPHVQRPPRVSGRHTSRRAHPSTHYERLLTIRNLALCTMASDLSALLAATKNLTSHLSRPDLPSVQLSLDQIEAQSRRLYSQQPGAGHDQARACATLSFSSTSLTFH